MAATTPSTATKVTAKDLKLSGFTLAQIQKMDQTVRNLIGHGLITGVGAPMPQGAVNPNPATIKVGGQTKWLWLSDQAAKESASGGYVNATGHTPTNNWLVDIVGGLVGGEAALGALGIGADAGGAAAGGALEAGGPADAAAETATGSAAATAKAGSTSADAAGGAAGGSAAGKAASTASTVKTALTSAALLSVILDPGLWKGIALTLAGAILILLAVHGATGIGSMPRV